MTTQLHIIQTWTIDDHPNPDAVFNWLRNHWHNLHDHAGQEVFDSLKGFCNHFDITLGDYSIAPFGDQSENITLKMDDDIAEMSGIRLWKWFTNSGKLSVKQARYDAKSKQIVRDGPIVSLFGQCHYTGICYDESINDVLEGFIKKPDLTITGQKLFDDCAYRLLQVYHSECEYIYSDEGLRELCEGNEYQFTESGKAY